MTTIIDRGIPKFLADWSAKQAAQYALDNWNELSHKSYEEALKLISTAHIRVKEEAADKGDEVHTSAENYLKGTPDDNSPKHMRQLRNFLQTSGLTPFHQEVTVWNRTVGYAGTADLIAKNRKGQYYLIDFKTGKGIWPEHAVQVEALARGEVIIHDDGTEEEMPYIHETGVLHLRPLSWWYHPVEGEEAVKNNWFTFLAAKEISEWKRMHPAMIWGTTERYNAANWGEYAA